VTVRRLHDIGKSGWLILIFYGSVFFAVLCFLVVGLASEGPAEWLMFAAGISGIFVSGVLILFFVWLCTDSQPGHNRFGDNPKNDSRFAKSPKNNNFSYERDKPSSKNTSFLDGLERLAALHKEGHLSKEEFEREKRIFLNNPSRDTPDS
jgi:hypothetical protein